MKELLFKAVAVAGHILKEFPFLAAACLLHVLQYILEKGSVLKQRLMLKYHLIDYLC